MRIPVANLQSGMTVIERNEKGKIVHRTRLQKHFDTGSKMLGDQLAFNTPGGIVIWRNAGTVEVE